MPTNILDLPLELRNCIYHELWKHTPCLRIKDSSEDEHITAQYSHYVEASSSLPSWLIACKQILAEASEQFRLKGKWTMSLGSASSMRSLSILSPVEARYLAVDLTEDLWNHIPQWPRPAGGTITPSPPDCAMFAALVKYIATTCTIRVLTINATTPFGDDDKFLGFDLSGLRTNELKNLKLEKLVFDIEFCCNDLDDELKSSLVAEIKGIGDEVFGGGGLLRIETRLESNEYELDDRYWTFTRERELR